MMKGRKVYSKLSILIIIIMLVAGTQVLAATKKPTKVTNLKASKITADSVYLTWNKVSGATGYKVYIEVPGYGYSYQGVVNATNKTITGLNSITAYKSGSSIRVKVIATNNAGDAPEAIVSFKAPTSSGGGSSNKTKPTKVTNLKASNITAESVYLTWNKVTGATGYKVYIEVPGYGYSYIGIVNTTYKTITGLDSITAYKSGSSIRAKVIATNNAGDAPEATVSFKAPTSSGGGSSSVTKPTKVTNLKASNITAESVYLSWSKVTGATGYKVYIEVPGYGYSYIGIVNTTYKTITGLDSITAYKSGSSIKVKVIATNNAGDAPEAIVSFKAPTSSSGGTNKSELERVTNIRMRTNGSDTVIIDFNKVSGAQSYEIFLKTANTSYKSLGYIPATAGGLKITGLNAGTTYYVKIRAIDSNRRTGPDSIDFKFTTNRALATSKPAKVTGLHATNITNDAVDLAWNSVTGATGYKVYVNIPGIGYMHVRSVTTTRTTVTGFRAVTGNDAGLEYSVKIIAYNNAGDGPESEEFKFNTPAEQNSVGTVSGISVNPGRTTANVSWSAVAGATKYEIYINNQSIGFSNKNKVTIRGLTAGKTYKVKIIAYIGNKPGNPSEEQSFTTQSSNPNPNPNPNPGTTTIGKVTGLQIESVTKNSVTLKYNSVSGADGYRISILAKNSNAGISFEETKTTASYSRLNSDTEYIVFVEAYKKVNGKPKYGDASDSRIFTTEIDVGTVATVNVKDVTANSVRLEYSKGNNVTGYAIYVREANKSYNSAASLTNQNTYTYTGLKPATKYYAKVVPYKTTNGNKTTYGTASKEVEFTTLGAGMAKVTGVTVNNITANSATIKFTGVNLANQYKIEIREAGKNYISVTGSTNKTEYTTYSLQEGKTYFVKVQAEHIPSNGGEHIKGAYSDEVKFTTYPKVNNVRALKISSYSAKVYWNSINVTGLSVQYFIYTKSNIDPTWRLATTMGTPSGTTINLQPGRNYQIKVVPYFSSNGSSYTQGTPSAAATVQM